MSDFDPSDYTRAPIITVASGITLARALVDACPENVPDLVATARDKLAATADRAQASLDERQQSGINDIDTRALDGVADKSWSLLRARLLAWAELPADKYPDAARARELLKEMLGEEERLDFLKESFPVQRTTAEMILGRIDKKGLQAEIDRLAGPVFLAHVREIHVEYDRMVKDILQQPGEDDLRKHVRSLQRAIVRYATTMCGTVDEDVPGSEAVAREALRPIIVARADQARRSAARARANDDAAITPPDDATTTPPADDATTPPGTDAKTPPVLEPTS